MTEAPEPARLLARVQARLNAARRTLEDDGIVDLSALAAAAEELCLEIVARPHALGRPLKPALVALFDDLDRLGKDIAERHAEIEGRLQQLTRGGHAVAAYGRRLGKP